MIIIGRKFFVQTLISFFICTGILKVFKAPTGKPNNQSYMFSAGAVGGIL